MMNVCQKIKFGCEAKDVGPFCALNNSVLWEKMKSNREEPFPLRGSPGVIANFA